MNKRIIYILPLILLIISIVIIGIGYKNTHNTSTKVKVIATTTQMNDITSNIGGDKIDLSSILSPNVDPHEYEANTQDAKKISGAKLIIKNGVGLERNIDKIISEGGSNAQIYIAGNDVSILKGGPNDPEGDPHIWFSIPNVKKISKGITQSLITIDPTNKSYYEANRDIYLSKLDQTDKYIRDELNQIELQNRELVTNHDAFGYFANEYGLNVIGSIIPSLSTDAQPSAHDTTELINKIRDQNVKAIFTEKSINPKLVEQIALSAGVKIVPSLYGDTLGEKGSSGETYISMMKYNTDTIVQNIK